MGNRICITGERKRKNPLNRLKNKSRIDLITNCWIWEGSTTGHSGYGYISYLGRMVSVHRLSAHLNLKFDIKPDHFYIGTRSDNALDSEFIKRNKLDA